MAIQMFDHPRRRPTQTLVWDRSILYVFPGSIVEAQIEGAGALRAQMFKDGSGVIDVPQEDAAVVWVEKVPYLFPRSLTDASDRGKGYKSRWVQVRREKRQRDLAALKGFTAQYGAGTGDG